MPNDLRIDMEFQTAVRKFRLDQDVTPNGVFNGLLELAAALRDFNLRYVNDIAEIKSKLDSIAWSMQRSQLK